MIKHCLTLCQLPTTVQNTKHIACKRKQWKHKIHKTVFHLLRFSCVSHLQCCCCWWWWWFVRNFHIPSLVRLQQLRGKGKKRTNNWEKDEIKRKERMEMSLFLPLLCFYLLHLSAWRGLKSCQEKKKKRSWKGRRRQEIEGSDRKREAECVQPCCWETAACPVCFTVLCFKISAQFEGSRSKSATICLIGAFLPKYSWRRIRGECVCVWWWGGGGAFLLKVQYSCWKTWKTAPEGNQTSTSAHKVCLRSLIRLFVPALHAEGRLKSRIEERQAMFEEQ